MEQPIISIIVPCYNGEQFLRETLDCLKEQTIVGWECIIVNDGSKDNSLAIAREYVSKDARYRVIDKANEGVAIARNVAIDNAKGKYILPLDADDLIAPTYAEKAINYLEEHPETKLVYCDAEYTGSKRGKWKLPEYSYETMLHDSAIHCSCVYRKSDFKKTKGYNPNMKHGLEDWDFLLSILKKDSKVHKIPEILFYYRQHCDSRSTEAKEYGKELCNRIVANHVDVYYDNLYKVIYGLNNDEYYKKELENVLKSKTYRIGKLILSPLRWLRIIFQ